MTPFKPKGWPHHVHLPNVAGLLNPPDNPARREFLSGASGEADRLPELLGKAKGSWKGRWGSEATGWREPEGLEEGSLVCLDNMYFSTERGEEVRDLYEGLAGLDYGPWAAIGRHLRWHPGLEAAAKDILRTVLDLPERTSLPPIFTMHIRRTDFLPMCGGRESWCGSHS